MIARRESGAALIIVVLLMMAITAIGHGLLLLARFEFVAARAGADQLGARLAAEAAVSTLLMSEAGPELALTALWRSTGSTSGTLLDASFSGSIRRLSRELWMAEGWGMRGRVAPAQASRALWILDPVARVAASTAVLLHGEGTVAQHDGTIDGSRVNEIPTPGPPEGCQRMSEALDSLLPGGALPATSVQPMHAVATLGALDLDSMRARIQARVEGVGTPEPRQRAGVCLTEYVWNWGDPGRPSQPCGRHLVTILAEGDLAVAGGVGQGLLVVIGDADLLDTRFSGLLIVGGRLTLRGSATVLGLVRAARGASLEQGASIVGSTCWATASLTSPILARPVPVRGPRFLGPR